MRKLCLFLLGCVVTPVISSSTDLTAKVSSKLDMKFGHSSQKRDYRTDKDGNEKRQHGIAGEVSMNFSVESQKEPHKVGGHVTLNANVSAASSGSSAGAKSAYLYYENDNVGKIEIGNAYGAAGALSWFNKSYLKGAGGIAGTGNYWITNKAFYFNGTSSQSELEILRYIQQPSLFSSYFPLGYSYATKLNYYLAHSNDNYKIIGALSYIPDFDALGAIDNLPLQNSGAKDKDREKYPPTFKKVISGGIYFESKFDCITLSGHITGETGKAKKIQGENLAKNLLAYETGINLRLNDNFTLSTAIGSWGKSGCFKNQLSNTKQGSLYWTLGTSYKSSEKLSSSLSYFNSRKAGGAEIILWNGLYKETKTSKEKGGDETNASAASAAKTSADGAKENSVFSDKEYNKFSNLALSVNYKFSSSYTLYTLLAKVIFYGSHSNEGHKSKIRFLKA